MALQVELAFWQTADGGVRAEDYALYLESCPNGKFAPLARVKLAQLAAKAAVVAAEPVPEPVAVAPIPATEPVALPLALPEPAAPPAPPDQPATPALADDVTAPPGGSLVVAAIAVPAAPADLAALRSGSAIGADALPEPELTGPPLYAALQTALAAAGCDPGPVDGALGVGSSRALAAFAAMRPDLVAPDARPSADLLRVMAQTSGRVCVTCTGGEVLKGGTFQKPLSCPSGQKLSSKGECYVPTPAFRKPARKPAAKVCVVFNGRTVC